MTNIPFGLEGNVKKIQSVHSMPMAYNHWQNIFHTKERIRFYCYVGQKNSYKVSNAK